METRKDTFEAKVRRKIAGWYTKPEYEDKAVARIVAQRDEIINLLQSTGREGIDEVLRYLDDSGFYYRASSPHKHHNWPGGLQSILWVLASWRYNEPMDHCPETV